MTKYIVFVLTLGFCMTASADIWRWVDANGETRFVDSNRPIYMWTDELGNFHYEDKPAHSNATSVQLVWHSEGTLEDVLEEEASKDSEEDPYAGETAADREQRKAAEAYYCERAQEIYDSYAKAPRLYKTDESGEKVFLSDEESTQTLTATKARVDELCD